MIKPFPSDRIGKESMKKRKAETCVWKEDQFEGGWDGSCGIKWWLDYGNPKENEMNFCPRCGKRIKGEAAI
jgi:hypothetical protein